jgi:ferredoxin
MSENAIIKLMKSISDQEQFVSGEERLEEIADLISRSQTSKPEMNSFMSRTLGNTIHKGAMKAFKRSDRGFNIDTNCAGCKTCQKICPRGNISFSNRKPHWNNDCEQCMACIQWCPKQAIQIKDLTSGISRAHNLEVVLADMM